MNNEKTNDDPAKENGKDSQVRLDTYSQVMACLAAEYKRLGVDIKPEKSH